MHRYWLYTRHEPCQQMMSQGSKSARPCQQTLHSPLECLLKSLAQKGSALLNCAIGGSQVMAHDACCSYQGVKLDSVEEQCHQKLAVQTSESL